jgi:hypothetical protein
MVGRTAVFLVDAELTALFLGEAYCHEDKPGMRTRTAVVICRQPPALCSCRPLTRSGVQWLPFSVAPGG